MTFNQLKIGDHFSFGKKVSFNPTFNLVGIKKTKSVYRMGGLNRVIGDGKIQVNKTTKEFN